MPIYSPTGFLDITNATLRTSNTECQNLKIGTGNLYVTSEISPSYELNLSNVTSLGATSPHTLTLSNVTTAIDATSNIITSGNLKIGGLVYTKDWGIRAASGSNDLYVGRFTVHGITEVLITDQGASLGSASKFTITRNVSSTPLVNGIDSSSTINYEWYFKSHDSTTYDLWVRPSATVQTNIKVTSSTYIELESEPSSSGAIACANGLINMSGNIVASQNLTVSGSITVDTDTLVVDSVNDRVGVGTTSPDAKLNVKSGVFLSENQASTNNTILYYDGGGSGGTNNNQYHLKDAKFGTGIFVNDAGTTGSTITLMNKEGAVNTTKHASIGFVLSDTAFNGKFGGQIGFWPEDNNAVKQQFRIYTSGTSAGYNLPVQQMVVTGDGNVGIGTNDPKVALHVSATDGRLAIADASENDCDTNAFNAGLFFVDNTWTGSVLHSGNPSNGMGFYIAHNSSSSKNISMRNMCGSLTFGTRNDTVAMSIDDDGNVGIGTTTPDVKFQVEGTSSSHQKLTKLATWNIFHHRDDSSFEHLMTYTGSDGQAYFDNRDNFVYVQIPAVGGETLYTSTVSGYNSGYFNARFRDLNGNKPNLAENTTYKVHAYSSRINAFGTITTAGNVGIGTSSPQGNLHLYPGTDGSFMIGSLGTTEATAPMVMRDSGGEQIHFYYGTTKVGSITSGSTSTAFNTSSDYRLKENIVELTSALDTLNEISVYQFNFISEPTRKVNGFIAHELQSIVPEAVTGVKDEMIEFGVVTRTSDDFVIQKDVMKPKILDEGTEWSATSSKPNYQGVDKSKLVPLLTRSVQELSTKNDTLETQLASVLARLDALENA